MIIFHDSHDLRYRNPFGAREAGSTVTLTLYAPEAYSARVRLWREGHQEELIDMQRVVTQFSVTLTLPEDPCVLFYYFILDMGIRTVYYGNNPEVLGGKGQISDLPPVSYQITVYRKAQVPQWYKDAVVYQIFPDRFARSSSFDPNHVGTLPDCRGGVERVVEENWEQIPKNEFNEKKEICQWKFYGGSLDGIREKLPYLQSLGITAIYLNPIFQARSTHRYDTSNYLMIDPVLGNEASFQTLAREAGEYGIRLILDGVFNHCGADSLYFDYFNQFHEEDGTEGAMHFPSSPYRSWFTFQEYAPGYRCWWNIPDMPDFVTTNPEYVDFITGENGVIRKWLRLGASGWRLDVADELPNEFLKAIRRAVKEEDPDNLLMGEVWDDPTNKYNYGHLMEYFWGEELDSTMNYPFRAAVLPFIIGDQTAHEFCHRFMSIAENYPPENFYGSLNLLGSHDRERVMNILGGYPLARYGFDHETVYHDLDTEQYALARKRMKLLSILQYTLPGVPDLYYGDETGMQGGSDPDCRRTYPWGKEDQDLVAHFQWLGQFYHQHPCLKAGSFELTPLSEDVLALERSDAAERILIIINRTDRFMDISYKGRIFSLWPYEGKIEII